MKNIFVINKSVFLENRYNDQFFNPIISIFQLKNQTQKNMIYTENKLKLSPYFNLYQSGLEVFKKYPNFGVGNKNYRHEACVNKTIKSYVCNTHPHQIYFELL